jgi:hypothetical protein
MMMTNIYSALDLGLRLHILTMYLEGVQFREQRSYKTPTLQHRYHALNFNLITEVKINPVRSQYFVLNPSDTY